MGEIKTKPTGISADDFLNGLSNPVRRADGQALRTMMEHATGKHAVMWGPSIVGFGIYRYQYASGHGGEMCRVAFSPRSDNIVLYVGGFPDYSALLAKLGKHKRSKACVYLSKLADVGLGVLEAAARNSANACAKPLHGRHQGVAEQHRPTKTVTELRANLTIGRYPAGVVVGGTRDKTRTESL